MFGSQLPFPEQKKTKNLHLNPTASTATRAAREKSSNSSPWGKILCELSWL